jgi:hypothetical protein
MQNTRTQIHTAANEWCGRVKPTHHLRLSLHEKLCLDPIGKRNWVQGEEIAYGQVYERFIRTLSKSLAPNRNVWKRFKPIIPNVGCLHGKWGNTAWHIHVNLRVSERVSDETLLHTIYLTALKEQWIPNGLDYVNLSPIRSGERAFSYTMKEGFDHVLAVPWEKEPTLKKLSDADGVL